MSGRMLGVTIVALLTAAMMAAPSTSHAFAPGPACHRDNASYGCDIRLSSLATYAGWAHVEHGEYCGGMAPPDGLMERLRAPRPAWRWNGAWTRTSIPTNTQVYVSAYAVGWSWVWTRSTGWVAMQDEFIVINSYRGCYWPYGPPPQAR